MRRFFSVSALIIFLWPTGVSAQDRTSVEQLAVECNICHVADQGKLRALYGIPTAEFIALIKAYQAPEGYVPLMSEAVQDLDEETLETLAKYYFENAKP